MKRIRWDELMSYVDKEEAITLVEALPERYWREGYLPGAIQMDHTEVMNKAASHLPDKAARVVVYCASTECQNSATAAKMLESLGYEGV